MLSRTRNFSALAIPLTLLFLASGPVFAENDEPIDFEVQIKPILERACIECHGAERDQGGLRMHTREALLEGGASGPSVDFEDVEFSEVLDRIMLDPDDFLFMPAEGDPLDEEEIALIRKWIEQELPWTEGVVLHPLEMPADPAEEMPAIATEPPTDEELERIARLRSFGTHVMELAQRDHRLEVAFHLAGVEISEEHLTPLEGFERVVHLNFRGTDITDDGLKYLAQLPHLRRLHLENTAITDAGLEHLKDLQSLEYLNLYGTNVTDEGVAHLQGLTNLRQLYLWQTEVTDEGVAKLQEALPELVVIRGLELEPVSFEEEDEEPEDEEPEDEESEENDQKDEDDDQDEAEND